VTRYLPKSYNDWTCLRATAPPRTVSDLSPAARPLTLTSCLPDRQCSRDGLHEGSRQNAAPNAAQSPKTYCAISRPLCPATLGLLRLHAQTANTDAPPNPIRRGVSLQHSSSTPVRWMRWSIQYRHGPVINVVTFHPVSLSGASEIDVESAGLTSRVERRNDRDIDS
jgi:hypothetical protein